MFAKSNPYACQFKMNLQIQYHLLAPFLSFSIHFSPIKLIKSPSVVHSFNLPSPPEYRSQWHHGTMAQHLAPRRSTSRETNCSFSSLMSHEESYPMLADSFPLRSGDCFFGIYIKLPILYQGIICSYLFYIIIQNLKQVFVCLDSL